MELSETTQNDGLSLSDALSLAIRLHKDGHFDEAKRLYELILEAFPEQPDALHFLGVLNHHHGRSEAGIDLVKRAITQTSDHADMYNNLGNIYSDIGRLNDAEQAYRQAISLKSDHVDGLNNLGIVLKELNRLEESEQIYRRALDLVPDKIETLQNLSNTLRKQGRFNEAIAICRKAIELMPFNGAAYYKLARLYYVIGRYDDAKSLYRRWLDQEPENPVARHMYAACGGHDVPPRASDGYIMQTFDGFAATFDKVLARLDYQAPTLVARVLARKLGRQYPPCEVLDAGCGTGLCGPLLSPYATNLTGVDLSAAMLAKAQGREIYDELINAELTAYMAGCANRFGIIAAADTLCYFGSLEPVLAAAANALKDHGYLAFTVEQLSSQASRKDFLLHDHGRYAHDREYIRRSVAGAGLALRSIETENLRTERRQPVAGLIVLAQKVRSKQ